MAVKRLKVLSKVLSIVLIVGAFECYGMKSDDLAEELETRTVSIIAPSTTRTSFNNLPTDMIEEVVSFLPFKDISNFMLVNILPLTFLKGL